MHINYDRIVYFNLLNAPGFCPKPLYIGIATIYGSDYYWSGDTRSDTPHQIFQYTISGMGKLEVNGKKQKLTEGKAFFVSSHQEETSYYYPSSAKEPWQVLFLGITGLEREVAELQQKSGTIYEFEPENIFINQLKNLCQKQQKVLNFTTSESLRLATDLTCALIESETVQQISDAGGRIVREAISYIEKNLSRNITVSELAKQLQITRTHLERVFKGSLKITPKDYMDRYKIKHACQILDEKQQNINETAQSLGYVNTSHFCRLFKRITGYSPGSYRNSRGPIHIENL